MKFKHRDCVSYTIYRNIQKPQVRLKRVKFCHLLLSLMSFKPQWSFWCGKQNEMFCIMCELLFFNDRLRASDLPALDGKSATTFCKNLLSSTEERKSFHFWGNCSIKTQHFRKNSSTWNFVSVAITCDLSQTKGDDSFHYSFGRVQQFLEGYQMCVGIQQIFR